MTIMIDPGVLMDALDKPLPHLAHMVCLAPHIGGPASPVDVLRAIVATLEGETPLESTLPEWLGFEDDRYAACRHYHAGLMTSAMWYLLLEHLPDFAPEDVTFEGDTILSEPLVVTGDLHVKGDLRIPMGQGTYDLLVVGDLRVDGTLWIDYSKLLVGGSILCGERFEDPGEWSLVTTRGAVRAGKLINSSGELYAGGVIEAPLITLTYNHGHALLMGGARAVVFHSSDHSGWIASRPDAPAVDEGELIIAELESLVDDEQLFAYAARHPHSPNDYYRNLYNALTPGLIEQLGLLPPDEEVDLDQAYELFNLNTRDTLGLTEASLRDFDNRKNQS